LSDRRVALRGNPVNRRRALTIPLDPWLSLPLRSATACCTRYSGFKLKLRDLRVPATLGALFLLPGGRPRPVVVVSDIPPGGRPLLRARLPASGSRIKIALSTCSRSCRNWARIFVKSIVSALAAGCASYMP